MLRGCPKGNPAPFGTFQFLVCVVAIAVSLALWLSRVPDEPEPQKTLSIEKTPKILWSSAMSPHSAQLVCQKKEANQPALKRLAGTHLKKPAHIFR